MTTLERPRLDLGYITPNWFASVMGTGIVATTAAALPGVAAGPRTAVAVVFWLLATALLLLVIAATAAHWRQFPEVARRHYVHPVLGHFYGAAPMAVLTVGAASLLGGQHVLGLTTADAIDWVCWIVGTVSGLATYVLIPTVMVRRRIVHREDAFGGWLMSVVPPMVSATGGALLLPHTAVALRPWLLAASYAMFGASLIASTFVVSLVLRRLYRHGRGDAVLTPTLWIVLGPMGQSIAAAVLLGRAAQQGHVATPIDPELHAFGTGYGITVWLLATAWIGVAAVHSLRAIGDGMPFALTWWSFTFPIGTYVAGSSALTALTGDVGFRTGALIGFGALVTAWLIVATRTVGGVRSGVLLATPGCGARP